MAHDRACLSLGFVIENQVILMQAAWIEWKHGRGAEAAMEWIENGLDGPDLIPSNEENGTDAQAYYDRLIGDSRDRQTKAEAQLGRNHEDRLRLWRGMGNDPDALPDDLSDADLDAMVARFTSNA